MCVHIYTHTSKKYPNIVCINEYECVCVYIYTISYIFIYTVSPPAPWIQPTAYKKNSPKKIQEVPKININLPCSNNYLHSIDTVLICTLLLALGIVSNLEMI